MRGQISHSIECTRWLEWQGFGPEITSMVLPLRRDKNLKRELMPLSPGHVPVDVVVTGVFRDRDEFDAIFSYLLQKRQSKIVRNIVFSTWKVVAKNRPHALEWCQANDILVVVTSQPGQTMPGNTWMQHKALLVGLEALPDLSHPVLKTRTDKALNATQVLLDEYERTGLQPADGDILKFKLLCQRVSLTMPFYLPDFAFIGLGSDLRKLIHFDGYYDVMAVPFSIAAEMRMFSWPFVKEFGFVDEYYRTVHSRNMSSRILDVGMANVPDYVIAYFFLQYKVLAKYFQLPNVRAPDTSAYSVGAIWAPVPGGLSHVSELFRCVHCSVGSHALLNNIANLAFQQDAQLERVSSILQMLSDVPERQRIMSLFSQEDLLAFDPAEAEQDKCLRFDSVKLPKPFGVQQASGLFATG